MYKLHTASMEMFVLTWLASLHVSHRSLHGKQKQFPAVQREAPRRCADGAVSVAVRHLKSTHAGSKSNGGPAGSGR